MKNHPQWENYSKDPKLLQAISVISKIEGSGYKAYIVGGTPRDMLLMNPIYDIDIATNCPIEILDTMFDTHDIGRSRDFGIVVVKSDEYCFEVAQLRQDGEYKNGRWPEYVKLVGDLKEDLKRRDFTVNTFALTKEGIIIDYVGGVNDIKNKVIRAVGNPRERFTEDFVRMIRAARFGAMEGFRIHWQTAAAIREMASFINKVTPERIRLEIVKAAEKSGKVFAKFIVLLEDLFLLKHILPEISALKDYPHLLEYHPEGSTVWDHTIEAIKVSSDDYLSHLAILFHDIGKSRVFKLRDRDGKPQYHRHDKMGAKMVADICDRLKFSLFQKEALVYATINHMKWHKVLEMRPSKIARLINSPHFEVLLDVCRADEFSRGEKFMLKGEFEKQLKRIIGIKTKWENRIIEHKIKLVDGKRIMELTDLKPSPLVGKIKEMVEDIIIDNEIDPDDQNKVDELIMEVYKDV